MSVHQKHVMRRTVGRIVLVAACASVISGCAHVQPTRSWPRLAERLKPGTPVAVIDVGGVEVRGRVAAVSATSLTLKVLGAPRDIAAGDIVHLRREGDPLWNGLGIGAGVGLLFVGLSDNVCVGTPSPSCTGSQVPKRAAAFAVMAAAGAVIDALLRHDTKLYERASGVAFGVVPVVSPGQKAVSFAIGWSNRGR